MVADSVEFAARPGPQGLRAAPKQLARRRRPPLPLVASQDEAGAEDHEGEADEE